MIVIHQASPHIVQSQRRDLSDHKIAAKFVFCMILLRLRTIARYGSVLVPSLKSDLQRVSLSSICRPLLTVKHEWNDPMPMAMPMAMAMEPLSWRPPPPCQVGDNSEDLDTPALVVDMDVVDRNLRALSKQMQQYPNVSVRPHVKAHKCPQLAKLQVPDHMLP